jgi:hypothetical protein
MPTAAHPITNPTIIITVATKVIAIMAYAPDRVAPGAPATPKIAIAPIRAFPAYLSICFPSMFDEEIIQYDLQYANTSSIHA